MDSDPRKPREKVPAPSRRVRLVCWLGVYLLGCLIVDYVCNWHSYFYFSNNLNHILLYLPQTAFLFPFGFGGLPWLFTCLLFNQWHVPLDSSEINDSPLTHWMQAVNWVFLVGGPITYIVHLRQTWKATTRRRFRYLMFALIFLVCTNLVGCVGWSIPERKTRYYPERMHHQ